MAVLTPGAWASTTPSLSLDQSAGHQAGSTTNLGLDLKFANTGTDSPHDLTLSLPPGLLANAAVARRRLPEICRHLGRHLPYRQRHGHRDR